MSRRTLEVIGTSISGLMRMTDEVGCNSGIIDAIGLSRPKCHWSARPLIKIQ